MKIPDNSNGASNLKILGMCGSPRKGNTEWLMRELMRAIEKRGGKTELITLKDKNIKICDGCLSCSKTGLCHLKDEVQEIYENILSADVVLLGSPTYMHAPTSLIMAFIHRMNPLCGKVKGKLFARVVVGQLTGQNGTASRGKVEDYFGVIAGLFEWENVGSSSEVAQGSNDASKIINIEEKMRKTS